MITSNFVDCQSFHTSLLEIGTLNNLILGLALQQIKTIGIHEYLITNPKFISNTEENKAKM